jgi:hypothetical protein
MRSDSWFWLVPVGIAAFILLIVLGIYVPVFNDCNERGGEVVLNAFNLPVCVAGAPK